ncbi:hypothetical protein [Bosea sp. (in: a-proteobacteria)]|uniref:hypothetical protein n=1 Tax=Bosea sp. (in: a-proteobacteria) TaxID=1871050 RepID=UPI0040343505
MHLKLTQPETYNKLRESTVRGWFLKGSLTQLTAEAQASLLRGFGHHHPPTSSSTEVYRLVMAAAVVVATGGGGGGGDGGDGGGGGGGGGDVADVDADVAAAEMCPPLAMQIEIKDRLLALRQGGVALNHTTTRSVMLAVIQQREPHLLSSNGGALRLSAHFVRDLLENQLNWVAHMLTHMLTC